MNDDALEARIRRATNRLSQRQARRLLRQMRQEDRELSRARRHEARQQSKLGAAVLAAGLGDWQSAELLGLLLTGRDRAVASPGLRETLRTRGEAELATAQKSTASVRPSPPGSPAA